MEISNNYIFEHDRFGRTFFDSLKEEEEEEEKKETGSYSRNELN
jgi:hypothetical protein